MDKRRSLKLCSAVGAAAILAFAALPAMAQDSKSAAAAKELQQILSSKKMDSVAARDPEAADTFMAVLAVPSQLMVVSAKYSEPSLLNERLVQLKYMDVYMDLNRASIPESRYFITDFGADGLRAKKAKKDDPFDSREVAGKQFNFDGNWREDKMSEAEYMKIYAESDEQYARILSVLLEQAKK
ncbi:MAG: hypothetical protein R2745_04225 [Vicinamibacterales bacterium]